jgi:hypothetical protein
MKAPVTNAHLNPRCDFTVKVSAAGDYQVVLTGKPTVFGSGCFGMAGIEGFDTPQSHGLSVCKKASNVVGSVKPVR